MGEYRSCFSLNTDLFVLSFSSNPVFRGTESFIIQDHWFFGPNYQVDVTTHSSDGNPEFLASATEQYLNNQTGILTNAGADIFAWEQMSPEARGNLSTSTQEALQMFPPDWPEIEYLALDAYAGDLENFIEGSPETPYNYVATMAVIVVCDEPNAPSNVTAIF